MNNYFPIILILLLLAPQTGQSAISIGTNSHQLHWKYIETPHFKVVYHQGIRQIAEQAAEIAETIYTPVTRHLQVKPSSKITLIISDYEDVSNGMAYVLGHYIFIWAKPYTKYTTDTMHWLRRVITHELVHQFHYFSQRNFLGTPWELLSLGTTPTWFTEGIAQYEAERWDAHRDLLVRMASGDNTLLPRKRLEGFMAGDLINNRLVYEQGHSLVRYIAQKYGDDKVSKILKKHRKFPISFNRTLKKTLGVSESQLIRDWHHDISHQYQKQFSSQQRLSELYLPFQNKLQAVYSLTWSPAGVLAAVVGIESYNELVTRLYLFNAKGKLLKTLDGPAVNSAVSWSPDGKQIVYSKKRRVKHGASVDDLFIVNILTGEKQNLTCNFRASDPGWSPDGEKIVFCQRLGTQSQLIQYDFDTNSFKPLTQFADRTDIFAPAWKPDGTQLAFSFVSAEGRRDIAYINADGSNFTFLTHDSTDDRSPVWSPDGEKIAFISYQNNVPNLYILNRNNSKKSRITDVYGGLFCPEWHPSGQSISVVAFEDRDSVHVYSIPVKPIISLAANGQAASIDWHQEIPPNAVPVRISSLSETAGKFSRLTEKKYHAFTHIRPQLTLPNIDYDDAGLQLGIYNLSTDPLTKHQIAGSITQGKRTHFFVDYTNNCFLPSINIFAAQRSYDRGSYLDESLWEKVFDTGLNIRIPINFGENFYANHLLWFSADAIHIANYNEEYYRLFSEWARPFTGWINGVVMGYGYYNIRPSLTHSIHPDKGFQFGLSLRRNDDILGSDLNFSQYTTTSTIRIRSFLKNHIIAGRIGFFYHSGEQRIQSRYALGNSQIRGLNASQEGSRFTYLNLDYRFPLIHDLGLKIWYLYLEKICAAGFFDMGKAWGDQLAISYENKRYIWIRKSFTQNDFVGTFGAEMRLRIFLAGKVSLIIRGGVTRRWDRTSAEPEFFYLLGPVF